MSSCRLSNHQFTSWYLGVLQDLENTRLRIIPTGLIEKRISGTIDSSLIVELDVVEVNEVSNLVVDVRVRRVTTVD